MNIDRPLAHIGDRRKSLPPSPTTGSKSALHGGPKQIRFGAANRR